MLLIKLSLKNEENITINQTINKGKYIILTIQTVF